MSIRVRTSSSFTALVALLLLSAPALAGARREARLQFSRTAEASACPDEAALRGAIRARLGYDPFVLDAPTLISVSFGRDAAKDEWTAQLARESPDAQPSSRPLRSTAPTCDELAETVALTVALVVDPQAMRPPPATPKPVEPMPIFVPVARPEPRAPWTFQASIAPLLGIGSAPTVVGGGVLGLGLGRERFLGILEARLDLQSRLGVGEGSVGTQLVGGSLVACYAPSFWGICGSAFAGAMRVSSTGLEQPQRASAWVASAGPRVFVELPFTRWLSARASAELQVPFTRTTLAVGDSEVWVTPPLSGVVQLGPVFRFQ